MQMFRAKCGKCGWVHDVVTDPLPVTDWWNAIKRPCCPMCANQVGNAMVTPRALTNAEAEHKRGLLDANANRQPPSKND